MIDNIDQFPDDIFNLAFVSGFQQGFPELVAMAELEDWEYQEADPEKPNPILKSYIQYTYKRLVEENKVSISPDGQKLCFNTGLVTPNQEEIFALFTPNRNLDAAQNWYLSGWRRRGNFDLSSFSKLPGLARYYDDPSDLVFDTRLELRINIDHIIEENKDRFPENFRSFESFALRNFLNGAIDAAKVRIRRNYKTAIPQYYRGRVQLLLPICLSSPNVADLALAVQRFEDHYRGSTCLTLDMAYNNARQLARPDKDWLQP